jgi:hypothetical protein
MALPRRAAEWRMSGGRSYRPLVIRFCRLIGIGADTSSDDSLLVLRLSGYHQSYAQSSALSA